MNELTTVEETLPAIADTSLTALADQAEKRIEAMNKIKRIALKLTNPHDWVDENGRPYLQASGAEKVGRLFGISWRVSEPIKEDLEGGHFMYTYTGEFSLAGATIDAIGTRSSKDAFFKKYLYEGEGMNRRRAGELPPSEIDPGDVKKSAYTNLLGNGITRMLGIRNLTYDDLAEFAGIQKSQITSVEFKKGRPAGKPAAPAPRPATQAPPAEAEDAGMATEAQQKAIHAILGQLGVEDQLAKHEKVQAILDLKDVPTSMAKLTKAQASDAIQALQQEQGGQGDS